MTLEEGDVGEAAGATAQDAAAGEPRGAMLGVRYRTTDEILAHPGFPAARIVYIDRTLSVYDKASFPAGLVADAARTTVFGTLICIDAAHAEGDRGTWATLKRLKETVTQFGFLSPRQVDDLVGQLRARGYVDIVPFAQDGRMRLLRPTGKLLAWDRDFLSAYYTPLEMLYPEPGYAPAVRRDPAFQTAHRRSALDMFPITARFIAENADVLPFLGANSGVPLLMALSQMGAEEADSRIREVDLAGMRARFGVSRSHVRNVLVAAEAGGLLHRLGTRNAFLHLAPRWRAAFDRFIGDTLSTSDLSYQLAMKAGF